MSCVRGLLLCVAVAGAAAAENITVAPTVQVRLQGRQIEASELVPAVKAHVLQMTPWMEDEVEIRSLGRLNALEVPLGDVTFRVPARGGLSRSHSHLLPVEVLLDGKPIQTLWVTADICIKANILQAARQIPYGKALSREDVVVVPTEISDLRANCIRKYEEVAGQVLRRTLSPGDPLTREALTSPVLVRSGETVHLRLDRSGITLSILARAEQSGKLDQVIRVRSLEYMRPLKARVVGPGEVKIVDEK